LKVENKNLNISGYSVQLRVSVLTIKYFVSRLYDYLQNEFSYGLNGSRNCCTCKHMCSVWNPHISTLPLTPALPMQPA